MTLAVRLIRSREEAEEIVQDAFLRAYRNLDQFRGEAKFSTWFYRILYNLCMTRVARRRRNLVALEVDEGKMAASAAADEEMISVLDRIEQEELNAMIASEIEKLPEKFKTLVTLFYVQEMSYEEICAVLKMPLGTLKTNLFRSRNMLRNGVLARLKDEVKVT
jgi:RNA polymerase sigma-70 factor (ECF subfamily)